MSTTLPESIHMTATSRGTEWRLPPRPRPEGVGGFIGLLIFSAVWIGITSTVSSGMLWGFVREREIGWGWLITMLPALFLLPFWFVSLKLLFQLATFFADKTTSITLGDDWLYVTQRAGWFRRTWRRRRAAITQFKIANMTPPTKSRNKKRNPPRASQSEFALQIFSSDTKRPLTTAQGYDRDLLASLANALAHACALDTAAVLNVESKTDRPKVEIESAPSVQIDADAPAPSTREKPATSKAILVDDGQQTTIVLPETGFRGSARGLLVFAILWNLIINGIITVMILSHFKIIGGKVNTENIGVAFLFLGLFDVVGIALAAGAIHSAKKKAVLIASETELLFAQVSPIRNTEKRWTAISIVDIACDASGTEVNEVPLMQLQIITTDDKKHGLLTGRDEDELEWLAQELKNALKPRGFNPGVRA